jgi:predicted PurR-regulated permease PerM
MSIFRHSSTSVVFAKMVNPLICFVILIAILYLGRHVLIPFSFSCLLAILLTSPSRWLEKAGLSRGWAGIVCLLFALIFFFVIFYFISTSIISFKNDFPLMVQNIQQAITDFQLWLQKRFNLSTHKVRELFDSSTSDILPSTSAIINTALSTVSGAFLTGLIVFLQTFLLLLYRSIIVRFFIFMFAEEFSSRIYNIMGRVKYVIRSYIVGLAIEMAVVAVAYCGALFILGVKYALLLGVIGALLNLVPYLGIFVALILTALITFSTNTPSTVLWSVVAILIIHLTDSNILLPRIVGSKIKINALVTIMGVIIGGAIWDIPGMFLAVPAMAILKVVFEDVPPLFPFAILMDEDGEITNENHVLKKLVNKVRSVTIKKKAPR